MKIGDKVIYITKNSSYLGIMTYGKIYTVIKNWNDDYRMYIMNDLGYEIWLEPHKFIKLTDYRKLKLQKINANKE